MTQLYIPTARDKTPLKKLHFALLAVNIIAILAFGSTFLIHRNYEFIIYVAVIIFFLILIAVSFLKIHYTDTTLIGLTIWAVLHMAGGALYINDTRLYDIILLPLSKTYPILRYDQLVHIWGFGAATLTMFCLLRPLLKQNLGGFASLSLVLVMAGLGVGAFNEIVEALTTAVAPQTGVGGYLNTALDLIANFVGALLATLYIRLRYLKT